MATPVAAAASAPMQATKTITFAPSITIHAAPGMDEMQIADLVELKLKEVLALDDGNLFD